MINVQNKFQDNNLEFIFSGDTIEDKNFRISIANDVNFKPMMDFLIEIIPHKEKLVSSFEDFNEEDNVEKLDLIKETIEEIYKEFNQSLDIMENQNEIEEDEPEINNDEPEEDDLPF